MVTRSGDDDDLALQPFSQPLQSSSRAGIGFPADDDRAARQAPVQLGQLGLQRLDLLRRVQLTVHRPVDGPQRSGRLLRPRRGPAPVGVVRQPGQAEELDLLGFSSELEGVQLVDPGPLLRVRRAR